MALKADGTVAAWGDWWPSVNVFYPASIPSGLSNVVAISAGADHDLALRTDGSVVAWGYYYNAPYTLLPTNLPPAKGIAAGWEHTAVLLNDGTVRAFGPALFSITNVPAGLSNVVSLAAGAYHTLALKADGTVVAWGAGTNSSGNLFNYGQAMVPAGLSNVVAVSANAFGSTAMQADGTIVVWGIYAPGGFPYGSAIAAAGGVVTGIGTGSEHALAIRSGRLTPLVLQNPTDQYAPAGQTVQFTTLGTGLAGVTYQWQYNGVNLSGATNATLTLLNVSTNHEGSYRAMISTGAGSVFTADATFTIVPPPTIVSTMPASPGMLWVSSYFQLSVKATSEAQWLYPLTYQWFFDGNPITNNGTASNYWVAPASTNESAYSVTVSNAAGATNLGPWHVRVLPLGGVAAWGESDHGQSEPPSGLSNALAIAAGDSHSVAVLDGGQVVQWGYEWATVPAGLTNAVAVAAGEKHSLALRTDGTVISWGASNALANWVPAGLTNVKAVAAGTYHNVALLNNGVATNWGSGLFGQLNLPEGLTNVTAISAGSQHSLALKADGTVVACGWNDVGQTNVPSGLSNVVAVAAGGMHSLALKADGTVVGWGYGNDGQCTPPANLTNAMAIAAGWRHSAALKNDGSMVTWGDNSHGQCDPQNFQTSVKLLAAGGDHTLASTFSSYVEYPVDVAKDLLLIYNTNSADSIFVKDYYLAHRPRVSNALVLGIDCPATETAFPWDYTNQIQAPVNAWLAQNPTKRPQYVILFLDVPSRVHDPTNDTPFYYTGPPIYPSVSYQLRNSFDGWRPFITHLNMGGTNYGAVSNTADCVAYINKLEYIGTNYSPGHLILSASKGGYANTNYALDAIRHGGPFPLLEDYSTATNYVGPVTNGLLAAGVSWDAITFRDGIEVFTNNAVQALNHISTMTNLAGYLSWGSHSSLQGFYPVDGKLNWSGQSSWWIIQTVESFNGLKLWPSQGHFTQWFSQSAFGGTNYSNTPVAAVCHTDEPGGPGNYGVVYFGRWAAGKTFADCGWNSMVVDRAKLVGDPLVKR